MSASLHRVLAAAARLYHTTEADVRLGWDERAMGGLGAYAWLAHHYSTATDGEAALHVARPLSLLCEMRSQFEAHLRDQPEVSERMHIEGGAATASTALEARRTGQSQAADPAVIAGRLIQPGPAALTVGLRDLRTLAAAFLSVTQETTHV